MGDGRRRRGHFLCFGVSADAVADEDEEEARKTSRCNSTGSIGGSGGLEPELRQRRRRKLHRILSGIVRSVSYQERSRKSREDSRRSLARKISDASNDKSIPRSFGKSTEDGDRRPGGTLSSLSSSSSSSSSSAASSSSSLLSSASSSCFMAQKTPPGTEMRKPAPARRICDPASGLCLLLVSLFVMMFCGRLCAILWTSTWLCLVLRRNPYAVLPECGEAVADSTELRRKGSDEYEKKRIVLEGLLERNKKI